MTARHTSRQAPPEPSPGRSWWRRPLVWFGGIALAVIASLVTAVVTGVAQNWLDPNRVIDALGRDAPVQMITVSDGADHGWTLAEPRQAKELDDAPTDPARLDQWWHDLHATPLQVEKVKLVLQGNRADTVKIVSLWAHIDSCGPAPAGTLLYTPKEGTSDSPDLAVNLDRGDGELTVRTADPSTAVPYLDSHSIDLARGERMSVTVTASTYKPQFCRWRLAATEVVDDQEQTQIFDQPFAVSGNLGTSKYGSILTYTYFVDHGTAGKPQHTYTRLNRADFCAFIGRDAGSGKVDCETLTSK